MKKILLLLILIPLVSCKDWLAVKPFDSIEKEEAYQNELNTNRTLNGLYISLAHNDLYVKELSCGALDVLAQHYMVPSATTVLGAHEYYYLTNFNFEDDQAKKLLDRVFKAAYKSIANCNEFLEMVEKKKEVYAEQKFNTYMGEAIALRALLHFDMLRLFGPKGDELDRVSVPYYKLSTSTPQPLLPANEIVDILIADIDKAIEYLKNDPILEFGVTMPAAEIEFFKDYRNIRMNYYAANVLKARMCLYKGTDESKQLAYKICSSLLEGKNPEDLSISNNFKKAFVFDLDLFDRHRVYPTEIIFGIHNTKRNNLHKALFASDLVKEATMGGGEKFINYLYGLDGSTVVGGYDLIRSKMWSYSYSKLLYEFARFAVVSVNPYFPYYNDFQCVIRMGEVYAIAAETAPTVELKRSFLEQLRQGKGYDAGNADGLTEDQLNTLVSNEFEKETYGEGQFFFYAKRKGLNLRNSNNAIVTMDRGKFVPPLPESDLYNRGDNKE